MSNPLKLPWPSGYLPPVRKGRKGEEEEGGKGREEKGEGREDSRDPKSSKQTRQTQWPLEVGSLDYSIHEQYT